MKLKFLIGDFLIWIGLIIENLRSFFDSTVEPVILFVSAINDIISNSEMDIKIRLDNLKYDYESYKSALLDALVALDLIKSGTEFEEAIKFLREELDIPEEMRDALLFKLSSMIIRSLDTELSKPEADTIVQIKYFKLKIENRI